MRRKEHPPTDREASTVGVFLNVPYDRDFANLFLAYIAGLTTLGFVPRSTVEIGGGDRRLDRIFGLLERCPYSLHDLSRVEVAKLGSTPRFNMPFELGLAVAWQRFRPKRHTWFVFETKHHRIEKTLSDLSGTDAYIHRGRPAGVFSELANAFVRSQRQPSVERMQLVYNGLLRGLPRLMQIAGTDLPFKARVFDDLRILARSLNEPHRDPLSS